MTFLEPLFLCTWFVPEEFVKIETSKDNESNGYNYPEGGILCPIHKSEDAVSTIAQKSYSQEEVEIITT